MDRSCAKPYYDSEAWGVHIAAPQLVELPGEATLEIVGCSTVNSRDLKADLAFKVITRRINRCEVVIGS